VANTPIIPRPLTVTHNEGENRNASCVYSNNNPINICKKIVTLASYALYQPQQQKKK
jgi:hypothetical protein